MEYLLFLQNIREASPVFFNYFFVFISEILVAAMILIPSNVFWCGDKKTGLWMLLNYSGAYFVNQIVKNTACVYRPWIRDSRLHLAPQAVKSATGYSFPSGHTVLATSALESMSVWQRKKKWLVTLCTVFILLVALARNWLGAHTQYDVLGAIIETSAVVILNIFIVRFVNALANKPSADGKAKKNKFDIAVLFAGLVLTAIVMLYLQFKKYPVDFAADGSIIADPYDMLTDCYTGAGLVSGLLVGWVLERRLIHFDYDVSKKSLVIRGVVGSVILFALYQVILPFLLSFMDDHWLHFTKYFLMLLFVTVVYPAAFTLIEKNKAKKN